MDAASLRWCQIYSLMESGFKIGRMVSTIPKYGTSTPKFLSRRASSAATTPPNDHPIRCTRSNVSPHSRSTRSWWSTQRSTLRMDTASSWLGAGSSSMGVSGRSSPSRSHRSGSNLHVCTATKGTPVLGPCRLTLSMLGRCSGVSVGPASPPTASVVGFCAKDLSCLGCSLRTDLTLHHRPRCSQTWRPTTDRPVDGMGRSDGAPGELCTPGLPTCARTYWWTERDSNPRPPRCKRGALTN